MKTVIFLCRHNRSRSQFAEAYFNHINKQRSLRAISAGTTPMESINPIVKRLLEEKGIDTTDLKPKKLRPDMLDDNTVVITMGCNVDCGIFEFPVQIHEDWPLEDPHEHTEETATKICGQIEEYVHQLYDQLSSS